MKKLTLIFVLILFSVSHAQIIRGFGVKAGATFSSQEWKYDSSILNFDPGSRIGFNAGIFAEFLDIPFISLVAELNYVQKGMKSEIVVTTVESPDGRLAEWDSRIDYINLSALGKFRLNLGIVSPYAVLGPKIDFEINTKNSLLSEDHNKTMFGLKAGIGTEINLMAVNLLVEFLYDADFNELYEKGNLKVNTSSFDLRVGVMF